jgi:integrase
MAYERAGRWKLEFEKDRASPSESPRDLYLDTLRRVERIKLTHADRESREAALDALWDGVVSAEVERLGYGPEHGEHNPFPDDEWSPQAAAVLEAIRNAREGKADIPPEYREPFSETAARFIIDRQRDPKANPITKQTIGQMEAVYRLFANHISDAPLSTINRQTVASFLDRAKTLHVHWGRSPGVKKLTLAQLLAGSAKREGPRLSALTINRYVSFLRQLWVWAEKRGEVGGRNPFSGQREKVSPNRAAHFPWPEGAIKAYFAANPDIGTKGNPNPFYWLPRIALLSGMRLNEICSLEVDDIKSAEGVTYFDIARGKTDSAERVVPVHSALAPLLDLLPSGGFVFPDLIPGGPDKKRSWNIGKHLHRRFEMIEGATDFHAFRKNVAEAFERARVPQTETAQILGHGKKGITYGVYSPNGLRIDQKKGLVELLKVPL